MDAPKQVSGNVDDGVSPTPEFVLSVAGRRVKLTGTPLKAVQGACTWMCPPAQSMPVEETADWVVFVEPMAVEAAPVMPATWSVLLGDYGWPRLERTVSAAGSTIAVGQYRPQDALATITVDRDTRSTRVLVPAGATHAARWVDWLVRAYFGGVLLTDGWLLLHAAAVSFGGRVVLLGGAPGAGKSSLAHVLCRELGASFLGDDLVFVAPGADRSIEAIGWPTRVSVPLELAGAPDGSNLDRRHVSPTWHRERWLASPAEYCAAYGISREGSGRVAAVVLLERDDEGADLGLLTADDGHLAFMTDLLGLVGPAAAERHAPDSRTVAAFLGHLPVLRFAIEHVTTGTAELIWPQLRSLLDAERIS